jgi:hypothetical protein
MPTTPKVNHCGLCGLNKPLRNSHYLPKALYKLVRAEQLANPNPIMSLNGKLVQISDQYRGHVFCADCEDLLNKNGEAWTLKNMPVDYDSSSPLQAALLPLAAAHVESGLNVYNVSDSANFNLQKLIYFGMSIFWRAAVHNWKSSSGKETEKIDLSIYEEPIRNYLLGLTPFPSDVAITIDIWPEIPPLRALQPVVSEQNDDGERYWFYIPGIIFFLFVGSDIPQFAKTRNAINGIVSVEASVAKSIADSLLGRLKSQDAGPNIQRMLKNISAIRSEIHKK